MVEKVQIEKFIESAKKLETDDSEENFDSILKKIAKAPKPSLKNDSPSLKSEN